MKEKRYICYRVYRGKPQYRIHTLAYYRKDSISSLLEGSTMTWNQAKDFGWKCVKVEITINQIN